MIMKKVVAATALAVASIALAAPAHADDDWNFATGIGPVPETVGQEVAKVPVLAAYVGNQKNNAANGNVLEHAKP
ncbi:hypothetical protein ACF073_36865 [Streptomyces sp. NPDC015171]|uniref:hypothetical protein n=1 Tax=Streptomyces sp. NPDC015171 TaxID=3364945 RepID=UPI0036FB4411